MKSKYPIVSHKEPFNALQTMDLLIKLETVLAGQESIIAIALKGAIQNGTPATQIIKTAKEMIFDNENEMGFILGNEVMNKVKAYELPTGIANEQYFENVN